MKIVLGRSKSWIRSAAYGVLLTILSPVLVVFGTLALVVLGLLFFLAWIPGLAGYLTEE